MALTPTARTLEVLRKDGWLPAVVEKFVRFPPPGHRVDLYGIIDIIAMKSGVPGLLGIQVTSDSNLSARLEKARLNPFLCVWKATGNRFELHGWAKKGPRGAVKHWQCRVITEIELNKPQETI